MTAILTITPIWLGKTIDGMSLLLLKLNVAFLGY